MSRLQQHNNSTSTLITTNAMDIAPSTSQLQYSPPMTSRALTSSNSFDSKSNLPKFSAGFYMSAEATKLFNTLQQSPLPLINDVINS